MPGFYARGMVRVKSMGNPASEIGRALGVAIRAQAACGRSIAGSNPQDSGGLAWNGPTDCLAVGRLDPSV